MKRRENHIVRIRKGWEENEEIRSVSAPRAYLGSRFLPGQQIEAEDILCDIIMRGIAGKNKHKNACGQKDGKQKRQNETADCTAGFHHCLPLLFGGSGSESISQEMPDYLPERLEAGTQNAPAAAALCAGIRYIRGRGRSGIEAHERELCRHMAELLEQRGEIELFRAPAGEQSGVLSLRVKGRDCEEIAAALAREEICVRSGLHCAPLAHRSAATLESGTVRFSFSPFNTHGEIEKACAKLIKII